MTTESGHNIDGDAGEGLDAFRLDLRKLLQEKLQLQHRGKKREENYEALQPQSRERKGSYKKKFRKNKGYLKIRKNGGMGALAGY